MASKEKSAKPAEEEGERYRASLRSTTVDTGGGQLLPKGATRKNSGVITSFPNTHIFTLRRLPMLLPRRIMMAEGKGDITRCSSTPALWSDPINALDPNTPGPAVSPTFPEGVFFPRNLPPFKIVGRATYVLASIAEAKVAGSSPKSQAVPGDHLPSTPRPHPHPLPSAAATHSHHGRHRITQVFTHFIVETIPARVE